MFSGINTRRKFMFWFHSLITCIYLYIRRKQWTVCKFGDFGPTSVLNRNRNGRKEKLVVCVKVSGRHMLLRVTEQSTSL